ncbi:hypothetical protein IV203_013449 [Nitzschia inconspicua]|uniref:Uncharacterized protein n=1 Tax=Nitzschia inconspicua TaxID=303405 RepID=A0A9K3QA58_9STRA|nr:hypothetical protein IV203_013449 [Nitzschia inconspicua]
MRLAIASVFLADSLSRVSPFELHEKALELLKRDPNTDTSTLQALHEKYPALKEVQELRKNWISKETVQKLLKNSLKVECDPNQQLPTEADADIGILSCGDYQYCIESKDSSLGGFCAVVEEASERQLQRNTTALDSISLVCNQAENIAQLTCETCTTDEATYTGEFSCIYTSDCVQVPGLCGDGSTFPFCGTDTSKAIVNGMDYYHRESCFDISSPVVFSYCDTLTAEGDVLSCEQSINGVTCNSCTLSYNSQTGGLCQSFDCTNTDLGVEGNDCSIPLVGALAFGYLYSTLPCPNGCNLCGENRYMTGANSIFTMGTGETVSCFAFQMNALTGEFADNDYCQTLTETVSEPCGCTDATSGGGGSDGGSSSPPSSAGGIWSTVTSVGAAAMVSASVLFSGV